MLRWLLCLIMLFVQPALAGPLAGQDDPAYQTALSQLLDSDDPAALTALHDLAAAGNTAAALTLPTALTWFPIAPDTRRALRRIGDAPLTETAARLSPAAALWGDGAISPLEADQLRRALGLYELGETLKADALLAGWLNHVPLTAPLPEGFAALPAAPALKAMILAPRLRAGDAAAAAVLQDWGAAGRVEGAMAQAAQGQDQREGNILLDLLWFERPATPLPAETVALMADRVLPLPSFAPVRAFCDATCPDTAPACAAAFITLLGEVHPATARAIPLHEVMAEADFFATKRGARALLEPALHHRLELARLDGFKGGMSSHPALVAARAEDACFANAVERSFSPPP